MNQQDYLHEVDALRAPDALRKKIAALPLEDGVKPRRKQFPGRWLAVAAALALGVGLGAGGPALLRKLFTGGQLTPPPVVTVPPPIATGPTDALPAEGFRSYTGPILPLTFAPGSTHNAEGISVKRHLAFDFGDTLSGQSEAPMVRDRYVFQNRTDKEQYLSVSYPFAGSFDMNDSALIPAITATPSPEREGAFTSDLLQGGRILAEQGMSLAWEDYAAALDRGDYTVWPSRQVHLVIRDLDVHTYVVTDTEGCEGALTFRLKLADPEHTQIFTYGFETADGTTYGFHSSIDPSPRYLILLGGDLDGYSTESTAKLKRLTEVDSDVENRYLWAAIWRCISDYLKGRTLPLIQGPGRPFMNTNFLNAVANRILDSAAGTPFLHALYGDELPEGVTPTLIEKYRNWTRMEDILEDTLFARRVMYHEGSIVIPAGGEAVLEGSFYYRPSGSKDSLWGYDFSPTLGSNLPVDGLSLTILGAKGRIMVNSNLPPNDTMTWALDPKAERYFFEMK